MVREEPIISNVGSSLYQNFSDRFESVITDMDNQMPNLMKILIVEDNVKVREMIKRFVYDLAGEIMECADGDEAYATYTTFLPDWVLMDIKMKRMNGIEAAKQIKKSFPNAKIVIVTSYNDVNLRKIAVDAGVKGYVLKENLSHIRKVIGEVLTI